MSVFINSNLSASLAANNLASNATLLQESLNRLSSGSKIVTPSDDAGGLAVSMKLASAAKRQAAAKNNMGNALSFLQTQDGALKTASAVMSRISELRALYTDETKNASDLANYETEFEKLQEELKGIYLEKFNGINLFGSSPLQVNTTEDASTTSAVSIEEIDLLAEYSVVSYSWSAANTNINKQNNALAYNSGTFFSGWGDSSTGGTIAISTDGSNWSPTLQVPGAGIYSFAAGNGTVVAGSNWGKAFYSTDNGNSWTESNYAGAAPMYVSFLDGQFIGSLGGGQNFTSPDGITWTSGGPSLVDGVATNGSVMAVGTQAINQGPKFSTDGTTWTSPSNPPPTAPYYKVAAGNGMFVAVSTNGDIATSEDGDSWTSVDPLFVTISLSDVAFGNGYFMATGSNGLIIKSKNGVDWVAETSASGVNMGSIAFGGGKFIAARPNGILSVSDTGTTSLKVGNALGLISREPTLADVHPELAKMAINELSTFRSQNGAEQSRLMFATEMITTNQTNLEQATSRIIDVDVAEESTTLARLNILTQAGYSMLAQANQQPQSALRLLAA